MRLPHAAGLQVESEHVRQGADLPMPPYINMPLVNVIEETPELPPFKQPEGLSAQLLSPQRVTIETVVDEDFKKHYYESADPCLRADATFGES